MSDIKLPVEFSNLQELADSFAISDDLMRSQRIEKASTEELRQLVDAVWPRLASINDYLDGHNDESACLLGSLAEIACEAQLSIGSPSTL
jgi:hypothetical protein